MLGRVAHGSIAEQEGGVARSLALLLEKLSGGFGAMVANVELLRRARNAWRSYLRFCAGCLPALMNSPGVDSGRIVSGRGKRKDHLARLETGRDVQRRQGDLSGFTPGTAIGVRVRTVGLKGVMGAWSDLAQIRASWIRHRNERRTGGNNLPVSFPRRRYMSANDPYPSPPSRAISGHRNR